MATSWEYVDESNTLLELKLRDDVTFSDGEHFDAESPRPTSRRPGVTGPRAALIGSIETVEVIDPTTLQLHLSAPDPMLLMELTSVMAMMISPAALENENLDLVPVGSGPYLYDESASTPGDVYVYHANPEYWDSSLARAETSSSGWMTDAEARLNAVIAGQVDMAPGTAQQVEPAESAGIEVLTELVGWVGFTLADHEGSTVPALADVRVRQALNYAYDRQALLDVTAQGMGETTTQIFPPGSPSITDEINEMYPYDPDRRRELLAEAGFEDGFSFSVTTNARRQTYVEAVAGYLSEIGVTVDIELIDAGFIETWLDGNHPVPNVVFGGRHPYEMTRSCSCSKNSTFNPYGTADQTVAELYAEAVAAPDEATMYETFAELNAYVTEQAWFLVSHFEDIVYLVGPGVSGVETYPNQAVPSIYGWSAES